MSRGLCLVTCLGLLGNRVAFATPASSHRHNHEEIHLQHRDPQFGNFWGSRSTSTPSGNYWGSWNSGGSAAGDNPIASAFSEFGSALTSAWGSPATSPPPKATVIVPKPAIGNAPSGAPSRKETLATIKADKVACRKFPDNISSDPSKIPSLSSGNRLEITCWTISVIPDSNGRVGGDGLWLKTNLDCYVNEAEFQERHDYRRDLKKCDAPPHWVGQLQDQYKRKDCYVCPSLNCHSHNLRNPPYVDLECTTVGDAINGDMTWHKAKDEPCFFPGGVFDSKGWLGTAGGTCPEPLMCINGPCRPPSPTG